ncbi:MAG: PstS family phosphate ABC transporter substrate-binding protein [Methanoregulaceae archaeon]
MTPNNDKNIPEHIPLTTVIFLLCGIILACAILVYYGFIPLAQSASPGTLSSVNLTLGGSTTIQPISELLAREYMADHPGVRIQVLGGGSGAGVTNTVTGQFDIGAISRPLEDSEKKSYPNLSTYQIGGSAIVVIASRDFPSDQITYAELRKLYGSTNDDVRSDPALQDIQTVVQRSDASGTEEVFAQWLFGKQVKNLVSALNTTDTSATGPVRHITADGNTGMIDAVKKNSGSIGFVDFGYAEGNTGVRILKIVDNGSTIALPGNISNIHDAVLFELSHQNDASTEYVEKLTRPLNYIVRGEPSAEERKFITYSQSADVTKYFNEVGYFSLADITSASGNLTSA